MASAQPQKVGRNRVAIIAEMSVMIALAAVLNTVKVLTLPEGGSVTLGAMVPLLLFALRRGTKAGVVAGMIFGVIDLYFEPFVYNPIQFLLDYPLAFGALGLAGNFRARPLLAVAAGIAGRFTCHFLSGLIFFASFAPAGESPAVYSALYNGSYLLPEFVISAVVILVLANRGALKAGIHSMAS
ncbi:MAG: energy-coupled thiamine transporter ThiT [Nitrososphaerales archaeon]|nr:energy-coupled thiamine transporter ThiT [Nitrososphaerales archaeon]